MAKKKRLKKEVKELFDFTLKESLKYLGFVIVFCLVSYILIYHSNGLLYKFDNFIIDVKNKYLINDFVKTLFNSITLLGSYGSYMVLLVVSFIIFRKKIVIPSFMTICIGGAGVINKVFKAIIQRPRPEAALIAIPDSYSFPSGHTMCAVMFYMYIIHLVNVYVKDKGIKNILKVVLVIIPVLIGLSRVYLGVHYASDVIFGAIAGLVTYIPFIRITNRIKECFKW